MSEKGQNAKQRAATVIPKGKSERAKGLTFGARLGCCILLLPFLLLFPQLPFLPSGKASFYFFGFASCV